MRTCFGCGSSKTYRNNWYLNTIVIHTLCSSCYEHIILRPPKFPNREERYKSLHEHNRGRVPFNKGLRSIPSDRQCFICGSRKSYFHKASNRIHWSFNKDQYGKILHVICAKCNNRYIKNPINNPKYTHNRIQFKDEQIHLKFNPRKGICQFCGIVGMTTALHHRKYDRKNPLAHTTELCESCHMKESWRLGQLRS